MVDSVKVGWSPRYSAKATADSGWQTPSTSASVRPASVERVEHHGDLELAARAVELAGGRDVVGDADDGRRAAAGCGPPGSLSDDPPVQPDPAADG